MTIDVVWPGLLWLLAAAPLFVWSAWGHALAAGLCRAAAWTALVVVLAGPYLVLDRPAGGVCVVAAIDVSTSVARGAAFTARDFLRVLLPALGSADLVASVAFAGRPFLLATPAAPSSRPLESLLPGDAHPDTLDRDETDLAAAVAAASGLCPEGKQAALLLFTDGNETTGRVLLEHALAESQVPVFPVLPSDSLLPVLALRRLLAPAATPARLPAAIEAVIDTRAATSTAIVLEVDGHALPPRPVTLRPGLSVVALGYRPQEPGVRRLAARLLVPPGAEPAPGVARAALRVTRPVHVLWVSERAEPPVAALGLERHGIDVTVLDPGGLRGRAPQLHGIDVVVLDDVGHAALDDATTGALARWVREGGGLVVTGSEHLFGDAGFVDTPLARLLPVELVSQRPTPEEREPLALELVVDRSNSMGSGAPDATRMEYAKRAALAVLDQLAPGDLVGAIAFDEAAFELTAPRSAAEVRGSLGSALRQLRHGGGTDFLGALELARRRLLAIQGHVRHVILLTDGDTNRHTADHFPLIEDLMRADVSVTTIRIGGDTANLELLDTIATATGGGFHHVERLETLPQLMIRDTQELEAMRGRRGARARVAEGGPMLAGLDDRTLPPVARWAITRARPEAEVRLVVDAGMRRDPLLVTWGYGLGRVVALPLDFQAGAAGWAVWRDFGKLWTQLVRWAAPSSPQEERGADTGSGGVAREARFAGPNRRLLADLAVATGGRVDPAPHGVVAARSGTARQRCPLAPWLVPVVLVLVLADVALRRLAHRADHLAGKDVAPL